MIFDEFYKTIYKELKGKKYRIILNRVSILYPFVICCKFFIDMNIPNML